MVASPRAFHPGLTGANSDASASATAENKGWGFCAFGRLCAGRWSRETRDALEKGLLSINPLELLGSVFLLDFLGRSGLLPREEGRVILRNDNLSACDTVNRGGAYTAPMRAALRRMREVCTRYGCDVWLIHVDGERNGIADRLSRGDPDTAVRMAREAGYGKVVRVEAPPEAKTWELSLVQAAKERRLRTATAHKTGREAEN